MSDVCDRMKCRIVSMNLHGRSLRAEQKYSNAAVRLKNEGPLVWDYRDEIYVHLGVGSRRDQVDEEYFWTERLSRKVQPRGTHDVSFPDFLAPTGSERYPLVAWVTCGGTRGKPKDEWKGYVKTAAKYDVAFLRPRDRYYAPGSKTKLKFGFQNGPEFKLPGGELWWIRCQVVDKPRDARIEHRKVFEFDKKLTRWGDDEVKERARDVVEHSVEIPPIPGDWELEVTLMRDRQPFEPCAHTPESYEFKVKEWDVCDELEAVIEGVGLVGKTVEAQKMLPDIDVRVRNKGRFVWEPDHEIDVVLGNGQDWADFREDQGEIYSTRIGKRVEPGERVTVQIENFVSPRNFLTRLERKYFVAYVTCGGVKPGNIKAEWPGNFNTKVDWEMSFSPTEARVLKPGTTDSWTFRAKNESRFTFPEKQLWEIEARVVRPSGLPREILEAFEFKARLNDHKLYRNERFTAVSPDFEVPERQGEYELELNLLRDGKPFAADGNGASYTFRVEPPEVEVAVAMAKTEYRNLEWGETVGTSCRIHNIGVKTFPARDWQVLLIAKPPSSSTEIEMAKLTSGPELTRGKKYTWSLSFRFGLRKKVRYGARGSWTLIARFVHDDEVFAEHEVKAYLPMPRWQF